MFTLFTCRIDACVINVAVLSPSSRIIEVSGRCERRAESTVYGNEGVGISFGKSLKKGFGPR